MNNFPKEMKAAVIPEHGGPEVIRLETVPVPQLQPNEALIKVKYTALNHLDIFAREGLKGPGVPKITLPHVSGVDIVGEVIAYGSAKSAGNKELPELNRRVLVNSAFGCGTCRYCRNAEPSMCKNYKIVGEHLWGGLAEYVKVPAQNIIEIPEQVSSVKAAAVPAVYTTAWRGVVTVGQIKPSDTVLVVGASGGLGSAQMQIAVLMGADVIAIVGNEEKREKALAMGAAEAFYSHENWLEKVMDWTNGYGVQLALDCVGVKTIRNSLNALDQGGKLILSGATSGDFPDLSIREIYQHHRKILGAPMGNWEDFLQVTSLVFRGKLDPVIHQVYPLNELGVAQEALEKRNHFGKIVIEIDPS
ncbi:zinc-binding dehydrogenase [Virgibacillus kimchii]